MDWKEKFEYYENNKEWSSAITLLENTINYSKNDVEANIRLIYLIHNILVEEEFCNSDYEIFSKSLRKHFEASLPLFYDNPEYLFFIGKILFIAEWLFGIDDDNKVMEQRKAFQMQKKAHEIDPKNILFEWAYKYSLGDDNSKELAMKILQEDSMQYNWLKTKGFPGRYIIRTLEFCIEDS